jgi:manganese-dependent inorganic pyrophosphatase
MDIQAAQALASIAGIECESYAREMFAAGSDLGSRTPEEIVYQDFKKFEFGDWNIGIGQITSMSEKELDEIAERLIPYLDHRFEERSMDIDMLFFMLTDIINESTRMLCYGKEAGVLIEEAYHQTLTGRSVQLPGVVSRKKQVVPTFMNTISRMNMA